MNNKTLEKIKSWIESKGYTLRFGVKDYVDYDEKEVVLYYNRYNQKHMIYSALHECGHIVVGHRDDYNRDYKSIVKADIDGRHYRSNLYKYKKLREEIEAWEEGFVLAKELGLRVSKDDYDKYAARNFVTYC